MDRLVKMLHEGGYSCVIENGTVRTFSQRGVADLFDLYTDEPAFLKGARVADKVVGKAATALMILGGVERVYADVISEPAFRLFRDAGVDADAAKTVPFVENRDKTGWCPLESACRELPSAKEAYPVIRDFVMKIRAVGR